MAARFYCQTAFPIPARSGFVLAGQVVEGNVKPGMRVLISSNSSFSMAVQIAAVELVNSTVGADGGLVLFCADQEELDLLQGLNIGEEVLLVEDPASSPCSNRRR